MPIKVNRFFILAVVALLLSGCGIGFSCDEESPAVAAARALDSARLNRLYADAERLFLNTPVRRDTRVEVSPIPKEFKDIGPVLMRVRAGGVFPSSVMLRLNGCLDHHVDLHVTSIGNTDANITVYWGDGPSAGSEVLWKRTGG